MLGAIIGDIVGSRFEFNNIKTKDFEFMPDSCFFTDDSVLTIAVAKAILDSGKNPEKLGDLTVSSMQEIGRPYPYCGYGGMFRKWMYSDNPQPYGSYGNGSAMRVSSCGYAADSLEEAIVLSKIVTEITHNHQEGIKGAEATTVAVFMALNGKNISDIKKHINENYYPMDFTLSKIRDSYKFNEICQDTVPQGIVAFLESSDFEDAVRNAISIGGDSDTLGAIAGGIAGAYYGISDNLRENVLGFLDNRLLNIHLEFENKYLK